MIKSSMLDCLNKFASQSSNGEIEVYNEAGIQFELAILLRKLYSKQVYKIQLERNINYFELSKKNFLKKEMDIVAFSEDKKEKHCIELKFPTNGQYPEQMFKACKDVRFLEQLVNFGFSNSYFMMFTYDHLFYEGGRNHSEIYKVFRDEKIIKGRIRKPTGEKDEILNFEGEYKINWHGLDRKLKCFIIEVQAKD